MDLVNLMYQYINKFINSVELLKSLKGIDLSKYTDEEVTIIKELILKVNDIMDTTPNEIDEVEKKRIDEVNHLLGLFEDEINNEKTNEETREFLSKQYQNISKDKENIRDGGELYEKIFTLMTQNDLVCKYAGEMDDKQLLKFITKYISVPFPPVINQETFNDLVKAGIEDDEKEALWRLAVNYHCKSMDFSLIEDYFISKKDAYYLVELISTVREDLDFKKLISKIKKTEDKLFIDDVKKRLEDISLDIGFNKSN